MSNSHAPTAQRAVLNVFVLGLLWALFDQVTKFLVVHDLTTLFPQGASLGEQLSLYFGTDHLYGVALPPAKILGEVWHHVYVQNPAGAFGLLGDAPLAVRRVVFILVACLATAGLLFMAARSVSQPLVTPRVHRFALGLVFGGAIGNLSDRIAHGYVIDFIDWHIGASHWPAFNIADVGIVVGVVALILFGKLHQPTPSTELSPGGAHEEEGDPLPPDAQPRLAQIESKPE